MNGIDCVSSVAVFSWNFRFYVEEGLGEFLNRAYQSILFVDETGAWSS